MAFIVTVQAVPDTLSQPVQKEKLWPPAVGAADKVTTLPLLYMSVNRVVPLLLPPLSVGLTVIATPLPGLVEATVRIEVPGGT